MPWIFIAITLATIGVNFLLFVTVFRYRTSYKSESAILNLHIRSVGLLFFIGLLLFSINPGGEYVIAVFTGLMIHGIYSLTFLEFWALSQGSFSLEALKKISHGQFNAEIVQQLINQGDEKLQSRIAGLEKSGWLRLTHSEYHLTRKGYALAFFLKSIQKICMIKDAG